MHGTISSIWGTKACVSFKTKLENDSDIDQSGCTALPTCHRHVVNGTHCVGVSVLTNRLRETHARGGHWVKLHDSLLYDIVYDIVNNVVCYIAAETATSRRRTTHTMSYVDVRHRT